MNEYDIGHLAVGGLFGVSLACLLYMYGGRKYKIIRRLGSAVVLTTTVCLLTLAMGKFNWWLLGILPLLFGGFSMGYGGDSIYIKLTRRFLYTVGVLSSGLLICIVLGGNAWFVLPAHVLMGILSIYLGIKNPIHAASEEVFICAMLNLGLVMYPFIV